MFPLLTFPVSLSAVSDASRIKLPGKDKESEKLRW